MIRNRSALATSAAHEVALDCVEAGISRALPETVVAESIRLDGSTLHVADATYDLDAYEDVVVVGGGNAAGHLAAALEDVLGERIRTGVVVTDAPAETTRIDVVEGAHPVPDEAGRDGAQRVLELAREATEETLVVALITGGGSALLPAPAEGVPLADLQAVTDALVRSGATIDEINAVRKHVSALKGGQLARAAAPATVVGLVMSDVVGDRLDVIASGPVVPDESTFAEAQTVLAAFDVDAPDSVRARIEAGVAGEVSETPKPGDAAFDRVTVHVLADGMTALEAAAEAAAARDYEPLILSSRVRGEASEAAKTHAGIAEEIAESGTPISGPAVVLSGGETTVTVEGDGEGGPNQEFALSLAVEASEPGIVCCAADTDGIDGATDAAGALVTAETAVPASEARAALRSNDVYPFLADRDALLETGPTGTNVNDLRVLVVEE
jgi:hydroxypyruvate reductase